MGGESEKMDMKIILLKIVKCLTCDNNRKSYNNEGGVWEEKIWI